MKLTEVGILACLAGNVFAALPLTQRAGVPSGFAGGSCGVRNNVPIGPHDGVTPPHLQRLRMKCHSSNLYDMPPRDGIGRTRKTCGRGEGHRGKPSRVYALTGEGEELFPKAYALVLSQLVEEIVRVDGWERATALLRAVGQRVASEVAVPADEKGRVALAAAALRCAALRCLGGDVEVQHTEQGYVLQGYGCPLSAVTAEHPQVCALAQALVEEITGQSVTECCERNGRPRCRFHIEREPKLGVLTPASPSPATALP